MTDVTLLRQQERERDIREAVVKVIAYRDDHTRFSSGFLVSHSWTGRTPLVVTAFHGIEGADEIVAYVHMRDPQGTNALLLGEGRPNPRRTRVEMPAVGSWTVDKGADIAVVQLPETDEFTSAHFETLDIRPPYDRRGVAGMEEVVILGYPEGKGARDGGPYSRKGLVASPTVGDHFYLDGFIFVGNSGGPVLLRQLTPVKNLLTLQDQRSEVVVDITYEYRLVGMAIETEMRTVKLESDGKETALDFESELHLTLAAGSHAVERVVRECQGAGGWPRGQRA